MSDRDERVTPDPTPAGIAAGLAEWLARQFNRVRIGLNWVIERLADVEDTLDAHIAAEDPHVGVVSQGTALLYLEAVEDPATTITLIDADYQLIDGTLEGRTDPEIDAEADDTDGTITFLETGYWVVHAFLSMSVTGNPAADVREVALGLWDVEEEELVRIIDWVNVGLSVGRVSLNGTQRWIVNEDRVGKKFCLVIWSPTADDIDVETIDYGEFWAVRVSHSSVEPEVRV